MDKELEERLNRIEKTLLEIKNRTDEIIVPQEGEKYLMDAVNRATIAYLVTYLIDNIIKKDVQNVI